MKKILQILTILGSSFILPTVAAPKMAAALSPGLSISVAPSTLTILSQNINQPGFSDVTVTNTSTQNEAIGGSFTSGNGNFSVVSSPSISTCNATLSSQLKSGSSCIFRIQYYPTQEPSANPETNQFTVTANASDTAAAENANKMLQLVVNKVTVNGTLSTGSALLYANDGTNNLAPNQPVVVNVLPSSTANSVVVELASVNANDTKYSVGLTNTASSAIQCTTTDNNGNSSACAKGVLTYGNNDTFPGATTAPANAAPLCTAALLNNQPCSVVLNFEPGKTPNGFYAFTFPFAIYQNGATPTLVTGSNFTQTLNAIVNTLAASGLTIVAHNNCQLTGVSNSTTCSYDLINTSTTAVSNIQISGLSNPLSLASNACTASLAANASCSFSVNYAPATNDDGSETITAAASSGSASINVPYSNNMPVISPAAFTPIQNSDTTSYGGVIILKITPSNTNNNAQTIYLQGLGTSASNAEGDFTIDPTQMASNQPLSLDPSLCQVGGNATNVPSTGCELFLTYQSSAVLPESVITLNYALSGGATFLEPVSVTQGAPIPYSSTVSLVWANSPTLLAPLSGTDSEDFIIYNTNTKEPSPPFTPCLSTNATSCIAPSSNLMNLVTFPSTPAKPMDCVSSQATTLGLNSLGYCSVTTKYTSPSTNPAKYVFALNNQVGSSLYTTPSIADAPDPVLTATPVYPMNSPTLNQLPNPQVNQLLYAEPFAPSYMLVHLTLDSNAINEYPVYLSTTPFGTLPSNFVDVTSNSSVVPKNILNYGGLTPCVENNFSTAPTAVPTSGCNLILQYVPTNFVGNQTNSLQVQYTGQTGETSNAFNVTTSTNILYVLTDGSSANNSVARLLAVNPEDGEVINYHDVPNPGTGFPTESFPTSLLTVPSTSANTLTYEIFFGLNCAKNTCKSSDPMQFATCTYSPTGTACAEKTVPWSTGSSQAGQYNFGQLTYANSKSYLMELVTSTNGGSLQILPMNYNYITVSASSNVYDLTQGTFSPLSIPSTSTDTAVFGLSTSGYLGFTSASQIPSGYEYALCQWWQSGATCTTAPTPGTSLQNTLGFNSNANNIFMSNGNLVSFTSATSPAVPSSYAFSTPISCIDHAVEDNNNNLYFTTGFWCNQSSASKLVYLQNNPTTNPQAASTYFDLSKAQDPLSGQSLNVNNIYDMKLIQLNNIG